MNHTEAKLEDIYLDGSCTLDDEALNILGTKHRSHLTSIALLNYRTVAIEGLNAFVTALVTEEKLTKHQQQWLDNNNSVVIHDHRRPKLRQLSLYHLIKDIDIQQRIAQIITPLIEINPVETDNSEEKRELQLLQGFDWVTNSPPPEDNEQLIDKLERITSIMRNTTKKRLEIRTLYGTQQY